MARISVTVRRRQHGLHLHFSEHRMELLNVFVAVLGLVGCFGFFFPSSHWYYEFGCRIAILSCTKGTLICAHTLYEAHVHTNHRMTALERSEHHAEVWECSLYLIGNVALGRDFWSIGNEEEHQFQGRAACRICG